MKITKAYFENLAHLETGLGKSIVTIDFSNMTNIINLLIGPMGSGKTTILGHLQPWAGFGTLDERNSDNIITPGKDGCKMLEFKDGNDVIVVRHEWKWQKDHHSLKSYITLNGEELNKNGNISSFKELVEDILGIDQNYLRLVRIGPNVSNIITLSSTERKSYFAEMLSQTEIYLMILKSMREQSRTISAQAQLLSKKISNITEDDIANMRSEHSLLTRRIAEHENVSEDLNGKMHTLQAEINVLSSNRTLSEYSSGIELEKRKLTKMRLDVDEIYDRIEKLEKEYGNDKTLNRELGKCDADLGNNARLLSSYEDQLQIHNNRLANLRKLRLSCSNSEHIDELRRMKEDYIHQMELMRDELSDFRCPYSSAEIKLLMSELQTASQLMSSVIEFDAGTIGTMLNGGNDILAFAKQRINELQLKLIKLQKQLNNVSFLKQYDVSDELSNPPCGNPSGCPYYSTHPNVIKSSSTNTDMMKEYDSIHEKIDSTNKKIEGYLQYPTIYNTVKQARLAFNNVLPRIKKLGICYNDSFKAIIKNVNNRIWYDMDGLVDILDKCDKRERLSIMESSLTKINAEIEMYDANDITKINNDIAEEESEINAIKDSVKIIEETNRDIKKHKDELEEYLSQLINIDALKNKFQSLLRDKDDQEKVIEEMEDNLSKIEDKTEKLEKFSVKYETYVREYSELIDRDNKLVRCIDDYTSTMNELNGMMNKLNTINLIRDASTPKEGIPLIYVKMFLDDCVDTINEMVSMVFDDIEILEFDIEHDFAIPYRKGDHVMKDIRSASQGERAIISLALSFALMRKGISRYNILLLDEIDGPLYSEDREKFLLILSQQIKATNAEQVFFITHNNCFEGFPVNIICTGDTVVDMKCPIIRLS